MKVSCININSNILIGKEQDKVCEFLSRKLLDCGITFNKKITIHSSPEQIKEALGYIQDSFIFLIGDKNSAKNYNIKTVLSRFFSLSLTQNQEASSFINSFYSKHNLTPPIECQNDFYIPSGAELLKSTSTADLGFLINVNEKTYCFLPNNLNAVEDIFNNFLKPYLVKEVRAVFQTTTIKTFGISEKDVIYLLQDLFNNKYKIFITTFPDNLEVTINIRYNKNLDSTILQSFVARVYDKLKKYIYSNEDISIYQMAYDLLKLPNKKLCIAETLTSGNIINKFLNANNDASQYLSKGIIVSNVDSLVQNLKVNKNLINAKGFVSVETASEMATSMLNENPEDIIVAICGEWQGTYTSASQLVCYIAVGDIDGIHVYKNTYSGEYSAIIDNISKSTMFYLIKKLKQNGLFLSQITI